MATESSREEAQSITGPTRSGRSETWCGTLVGRSTTAGETAGSPFVFEAKADRLLRGYPGGTTVVAHHIAGVCLRSAEHHARLEGTGRLTSSTVR